MSANLLAMLSALVGGSQRRTRASTARVTRACVKKMTSHGVLARYDVQAHKDVPFRGGVEGVEGARDRGRAFLEAQRGQEDPRAHARRKNPEGSRQPPTSVLPLTPPLSPSLSIPSPPRLPSTRVYVLSRPVGFVLVLVSRFRRREPECVVLLVISREVPGTRAGCRHVTESRTITGLSFVSADCGCGIGLLGGAPSPCAARSRAPGLAWLTVSQQLDLFYSFF